MTASTPLPTSYQVPPRALARASIAAVGAGAAILVLFVLPAEYGIDPTGIGGAIGLTRMAGGEEAVEPIEASPTAAIPPVYAVPAQARANIEKTTAYRSDEKMVTLAPHTGIEIKARMRMGDTFNFRWTSTGPVRADMHGEPTGGKESEFTDYWKQKDVTTSQGSFTAPFAGTHGWYWKNRENVPVTIKLKTDGFYGSLFERK